MESLLPFCNMAYLEKADTGWRTWPTTALVLYLRMQAMMFGWETAEEQPCLKGTKRSQWIKRNSGISGSLSHSLKLYSPIELY